MERLPQELVDKIIDHVDHPDLGACSLVGRRWVERSHWNWIWGGGYFSFIDQRQFDSPRKNLLTEGSTFAEHVHTLTLGSTAVQAWTDYFCNVDVVLPRLDSIIIIDARLHLDSDVAVLKRNFGNTLLSLSLNKMGIGYKEFHAILSSFPNLDNLSIARLNLPQSPPGDTLPVLGRRVSWPWLVLKPTTRVFPSSWSFLFNFEGSISAIPRTFEKYTRLCALVHRHSQL